MDAVNVSATAPPAATRNHPHLGVLLSRARRLIDAAILRALSAEGFDDLREAHGAVFAFLPTRGTTLTELARRARMTKQSMGELVRELEALGYVERTVDPGDARAKIISATAKGRRATEVGVLAVAEAERQWAEAVGHDAMRTCRAALERVISSRSG